MSYWPPKIGDELYVIEPREGGFLVFRAEVTSYSASAGDGPDGEDRIVGFGNSVRVHARSCFDDLWHATQHLRQQLEPPKQEPLPKAPEETPF